MKFYDPKDEADLTRIEGILRKAGIEYSLSIPSAETRVPAEINVAEEDVPAAEEVLMREQKGS